jgi:hypothetical protein
MTRRDRPSTEPTTERQAMRVLTLYPGRDTGVWCLARDGSLRPASPEIEGASVFLRFDGARLFLGTHWHEVEPPPPKPTEDPRAAYGFGLASHDDGDDDDDDADSTRTPFLPGKAGASAPAALTAPMPPLLLSSPCPPAGTQRRFSDDETRVRFRASPSDPPRVAPVAQEATARRRRGAALSPVRFAILAMMLVTVAVVAVGSSRRKVAGMSPGEKAQNRALAASGTATAFPVGATPSTRAAPLPPSPALPAPSAAATLSPAAPRSVAVGAGSPDERAAVLAVESGAPDRAGAIYDALAAAHPDKPAYREAARILRAKVNTPLLPSLERP